jgi:hypothetical protein
MSNSNLLFKPQFIHANAEPAQNMLKVILSMFEIQNDPWEDNSESGSVIETWNLAQNHLKFVETWFFMLKHEATLLKHALG